MSIFLQEKEYCIDGEALMDRNFPADIIIKTLAKIGTHVDVLQISQKEYNDLVDHLGSKFNGGIYGLYGYTMLEVTK